MYTSVVIKSVEIEACISGKQFNISHICSVNVKEYFWQWRPGSISTRLFTASLFKFKTNFALEILTFLKTCCTVIKYVPPDPCLSLLNCFSNGSVKKIPSSTYSIDFF